MSSHNTRSGCDRCGSISLLAVFAMLLLTLLLAMVLNVAWQTADKVRMQNAADAAAYSGGAVLARGMNTLAFTNHLLCETLALTALLREADQRNAEARVPEILDAWREAGHVLALAGVPKFRDLGAAIEEKLPLEHRLAATFGDWAAENSRELLPLLEHVLLDELIPRYQRDVLAAFPDIAQRAAQEAAGYSSDADSGRGPILAALWRASAQPVGNDAGGPERTLPVVDPRNHALPDRAAYETAARRQRAAMARHYLDLWNDRLLNHFDREAKMSQFAELWRSFTCAQLDRLLNDEYHGSNLPMLIHPDPLLHDTNAYLDRHFTFLGVTYRRQADRLLPGIFHSPLAHSPVAYAQVRVFVPTARLVWRPDEPAPEEPIGAALETFPGRPSNPSDEPGEPPNSSHWAVRRQSVPEYWDLWNQHWTCQLTPTTLPSLPDILRTPPPSADFADAELTLPDLGNLGIEEIGRISAH